MVEAARGPAIAVNLTEDDLTTALRSYILSLLVPGYPVIAGQQNGIAPPDGPYVVMTEISRRPIGTTSSSYSASARFVTSRTQVAVQVSLFGADSGNALQPIQALWRDDYAASFFRANQPEIAPLYASEPLRTPFVNAERGYEEHWSVDLHMQANFVMTVPQATADRGEVQVAKL